MIQKDFNDIMIVICGFMGPAEMLLLIFRCVALLYCRNLSGPFYKRVEPFTM